MGNGLASSRLKRSDILLGVVILVAVVLSVSLFLAQFLFVPSVYHKYTLNHPDIDEWYMDID